MSEIYNIITEAVHEGYSKTFNCATSVTVLVIFVRRLLQPILIPFQPLEVVSMYLFQDYLNVKDTSMY